MSSYTLSFSHRFDYRRGKAIEFQVELLADVNTGVFVEVKLDTGSDFCVFQRQYAQALNITLEDGEAQRIRTAVGSFLAYGHELTLRVDDLEWQATIYFAAPDEFPVNVVGRTGFLDRLRFGLVDYEQLLYLSAYNE